jgi:threonine/homoserine/homoserine lactone efflux protein
MFETQQLFLFIIATLLLNITPGQDTMYILGRTLTQGKKAGIISVLGINTGVLCHTVFAALGLALLLQTQPVVYAFIKMTGALYLIYLGIKMLSTARKMKAHPLELPRTSNKRLFVDGFLTNLFNPKVALFFITFLPQFIPSDTDGAISFLLLGQLFILCSVPWSLTLVALAAVASRFLQSRPQSQQAIHRVSGLAFIGMGTAIALQR